ncbi:tRNA dihydrouridine(20/20a) synthase DusA [Agitococcus lubricus]|uniref:tRNA-dihydrouridine(20/20a) synthase n=1 Tax=Agitococcus lubricus TaxID=1077255 RepID=A0A2T5IWV9_9GAMM|nr:tRNA dihydrouridine(20/20a) synthase DusA [Agitococcus lubricus]PTQ88393.1 tRNA-U16,U17-dihydrouridine synthase [Agitococcus lubricus]
MLTPLESMLHHINSNHKILSVAPMMDWTDRHCRYFLRLFNPHVRLYTEMVTTGALIHGGRHRFLCFDAIEHPVALQVGGSDSQELAQCAQFAEQYGYDEVNLNVGCPSDRVQKNKIGACLMAEPELVADCISAMQAAVRIPVTIKHRIGIDDLQDYENLYRFVETVAQTGCQEFIVHARIALLQGLSPKENREIPPLRYADVYQLKQDFPQLTIHINGGIKTLNEIVEHWEQVDGVMIGREAYHNPYILAQALALWGEDIPSPHQILQRFLPFIEQELTAGVPLMQMSRHILGLFQGMAGARKWRQHLSSYAYQKHRGIELIEEAASFVEDRQRTPYESTTTATTI